MLWSLTDRKDEQPEGPGQMAGDSLRRGALPTFGRRRRTPEESRTFNSDRMLESPGNERVEDSGLLYAVLKTMAEGVIVVNRDEQVLFVNDAARSLMDFVRREIVLRPLWEVSRTPALHKAVKQVLAEGQQVQTEITMPRTNAVVSLTAAALPHDPVPGAVLVLHDVTELRRLENRAAILSPTSHTS
jgi:two-component system phosphate regulon sensor histidine kinase PhoR